MPCIPCVPSNTSDANAILMQSGSAVSQEPTHWLSFGWPPTTFLTRVSPLWWGSGYHGRRWYAIKFAAESAKLSGRTRSNRDGTWSSSRGPNLQRPIFRRLETRYGTWSGGQGYVEARGDKCGVQQLHWLLSINEHSRRTLPARVGMSPPALCTPRRLSSATAHYAALGWVSNA
jgi:hypothetical protein